MNRIVIFLSFYKPFIAWSVVVNIFLAFVDSHYVPAVLTKLFLTGFAWYYFTETSNKRKLTFYKNLGISSLKLFSFVFALDALFTLVFLSLTKSIN